MSADEIRVDEVRTLWNAVIMQALRDAVAPGSGNVVTYDRRTARAWFRDAGPDFRRACELAELDGDRVRRTALTMIERSATEDVMRELTGRSNGGTTTGAAAPKLYEHDGRKLSLRDWSDEVSISAPTLRSRMRKGITLTEAIALGADTRGGARRPRVGAQLCQ